MLAATVGLLAAMLIAPSTAAVADAPEISRPELKGYKEDFGVSTVVAEEHLAIQQRGAGIVEQLEGSLGEDYAGVWFNNESGEFVIPTVADASQVSHVTQNDQIGAHSHITEARYTWTELEAVQGRLTQSLQPIFKAGLLQSEIDPISNSVVLEVASGATKAQEAKIRAAMAKEAPAVALERKPVAQFRVSPFACNATYKVCNRPLRGGVMIEPAAPGSQAPTCSAGFKAIGKEFGNRFMLTAGHCYATGIQDWSSWDAGAKLEEHYIGHIESGAQSFPTHDWAAIRVNGYSTYWEEKTSWPSEVVYWGGNEDTPIQYESGSYIGESVCHSGWTSGSSCGTVTSIDKTVYYSNCPCGTVEHLTKVEGSEFVASAGDSGGPVWSGSTALGLLSGGELLEGAASNVAFYVEITEATDSLGVTVGSRVGGNPSAVTETPSEIQGRQVTGNAKVDPNGLSTSYKFNISPVGEDPPFSTESWNAGSSYNAVGVHQVIGGLQPLHNYDYYVTATNSAGTSQVTGAKNFETSTAAPFARTKPAKNVIHQTAELVGEVEGGGLETTTKFEYGLSGQYEKLGTYEHSVSSRNTGSGSFNVGWKAGGAPLKGLEDGLYHFRYVATNEKGTAYGEDQTFLIDNRPIIKGTTATSVKSGSATLKGEIEPQNFTSTYHFELVRDSEFKADGFIYARKLPVPDASAGTGFEYHVVLQETGITLEPDTLYHYRLVATNVKGTRIDEEKTLRTPPVTPVSDLTFGSLGGGEGQLSEPHGLGEDESGNLWVADTGNSRLEQFSREGAFISMFGKHGSGSGEFLNVNDVAGMVGKIWGVDSGSDGLFSFSLKGQEESFRGGEARFADPLGITVNRGGFNIWVSDHDLHRVQEYSLKGEATATITGGSGNGPALEGPAGIQHEVETGNLWVADATAGRVLRYSSLRVYKGSVGENGTGTGQLHHPGGVAILPSGDVVVSDGDPGGGNSRIQVFSSSGEYLTTIVGPQAPAFGDVLYSGGYLYATESGEGVARVRRWSFPQAKVTSQGVESARAEKAILTGVIDPWGTNASYHFEYGTSKAYGSQLPIPDRSLASETGKQEAEQEITGLLPATTYHYRLVAVNSSGASYGEEKTFKTPSAKAPIISTEPVSAVGISHATLNGTVNPNGAKTTYRFEYIDAAHWAINRFGSATLVPVPDKEIASGSSPVAVSQEVSSLQPHTTYHARVRATNTEGTNEGTTYGENRVFTTPGAFNPPTYASTFGSKGSGNGQLTEAQGIAVDPSGNVWVSDTGNNRVQKFNSKGEYVCQIGTKGTGNGQFNSPHGLASDSKGNLWVADTANNRIEEVGPGCEYLAQVGTAGGGNGGLSAPKDVAIDPSGNIWVVDSGNARIEELNSKGEFLAACGSKGTGNGQFEAAPLSIGTDSDGNVWAGDEAGRMEKFSSRCAFLAKFDKTSSAAPAKVGPADLVVDPQGNLWVPSTEAHDVQGFHPEGEYFTAFGKEGTGEGQFSTPAAIAAGPDGTLWVIDNSATNSRVEKWTPGAAYAVQTGQAAAVKRTEATLTGKINPEGKATSYRFEYGTTQTFGSVIPATPKSIGSGTEAVAVSQSLDGLKATTTYYYHLVATTEAGTIYGETRHFTTLAGPASGSQILIGGQTFAELGIKEETVALQGNFTIKFMPEQDWPTYECKESGTGTLVSTGLSHENVTLHCVVAGAESKCNVEPISFYVNGKFEGSTPWMTIIAKGGSSCGFSEVTELVGPTGGSFQYGSEAKSMNVTASAKTSFGTHEVKLSGNSHWLLIGANNSKEFAVALPKPTATSEAASAIQASGATLNGTVNPNGGATSYRFEYVDASQFAESGYTKATKSPVPDGSAGSGTIGVKVSQELSGLQSGTTYHARLVAANADGTTSYGADQTFTTASLNSHWRIEGKTLAELEAWEPYESHGTFVIDETTVEAEPLVVTCQETGSGTLGYVETMSLSSCEAKIKGVKQGCEGSAAPFSLDGQFLATVKPLALIKFTGTKCTLGTRELKAESAFSFEAGASATELAATMSNGAAKSGPIKARITITSTWKLTGKYKGQKFGYS
jgi:streptogramin lyase